MNDVCEHGSLLLPPGTPWPAGAWTPYCRTCWKAAGGGADGVRVGPTKKTSPPCPHLSPERKRIGLRVWQQCTAGYGSTTPDDRAGHVCGCGTATPGVWRVGRECGPPCAGYPTQGAT